MGRAEKQSVALSKKSSRAAAGVGEKEGKGDNRTATEDKRLWGEVCAEVVQGECCCGMCWLSPQCPALET